ncbi:MAG: OmpA family protein [Cyclobacteriaceae bacterium]
MKQYLHTLIAVVFFNLASLSAQDLPYIDGKLDYLEKGDVFFENGSYAKALKAYEKGISKTKADSSKYFLKLANTNRLLNNFDAAETYYAKTDLSSSPEAMNDYAEVLAVNEKYDEASEWLSKSSDSGAEVPKDRQEGFKEVNQFFSDSLAYSVNEVSFNSSKSDFSPFYFEDNLIFVSERGQKKRFFKLIDKRDETNFLDLYKKEGDEISPLDDINDGLNEGPLTYVPELGQLLITANYREGVKNSERNKPTNLRILIFEEEDGTWERTGTFQYNNKDYSVGHPSYDVANKELYFSSNAPGGVGGVDLYRTKYENGSWSTPVNLGADINTAGDDVFPYIDGKSGTLYFASNGYGGIGGLDIYSVRTDGSGEIVNLGYPVNSSFDDFGFILDQTGKSGYVSSNRDGGSGRDDIYRVHLHRILIKSKLIDLSTNKPLVGNIKIIELSTGREVPYATKDGVVEFDGIQGQEYKIVGGKEGYGNNEVILKVKEDVKEMIVEVPIEPKVEESEAAEEFVAVSIENLSSSQFYRITAEGLNQIDELSDESQLSYQIKNVFFDYDSDKPNAQEEVIENLTSILSDYPELSLKISSYSDSRGTAEYNRRLAQRRADKIQKLFLDKGISKGRITSEAIGENVVFNNCTDGKDCTEEDHAKNRRVEFTLRTE